MVLDPDLRSALTLPVVCAPMTGVSGPRLVAEACKAGVMAGLPRHNASSRTEFEKWLIWIREQLSEHQRLVPEAVIGPLAVNLTGRPTQDELRKDLALCAKYGVNVVISAMGNPADLAMEVHDWGGRLFHDVTNIRFAEKAIDAGVDGLTCIVAGGGGHSGLLSPLVFLPYVRRIFDGTIILAGTVSNGASIRAGEILGADLVYLGTRFIATQEAEADEAYRQMLVSAMPVDVTYTSGVSGVPANWLSASLRSHGLDPDALPQSVERGNYDHLPPNTRPWREIWSAGQGVALIEDVPSVSELVRRLGSEYEQACQVPTFSRATAPTALT